MIDETPMDGSDDGIGVPFRSFGVFPATWGMFMIPRTVKVEPSPDRG
jgi:hypothetical protein